LSYQSGGQINVYFTGQTYAQTCSVEVYANGSWSNTFYNISVPAVAGPAPNITSGSYAGAGGSISYITLYGTNFSSSSNSVYLTCGGYSTSNWITYQSTGQINLYLYTPPSGEYCNAQVYANGQYSNVYYNIYIPAGASPPSISSASYAGFDGYNDYITMYGSNFGSSGNSVTLYCNGSYIYDYITYQSSGQINIDWPALGYGSYCSVQVTYNGLSSSTWYNIWVPQ
jgi:hypothetical protein